MKKVSGKVEVIDFKAPMIVSTAEPKNVRIV